MHKTVLTVVFLVFLAGCVGIADNPGGEETSTETPADQGSDTDGVSWRTAELSDVRTNDSFTIGNLSKPVLIESFAIWCPPCTRQQQEIKALKDEVNASSVSVNVDPEEDDGRVRQHASDNGFDWRYVTPPKQTTRLFVEAFGRTFISPPSVPVILVCDENTSKLLDRGVNTVTELRKEINTTCDAT